MGRRRKASRGWLLAALAGGLLLFGGGLHLAERAWRSVAPAGADPADDPADGQPLEPLRPVVRVEGRLVRIEYGKHLMDFGTGDPARAEHLASCIRDGLDRAAAEPTAMPETAPEDEVPAWLARVRQRDRVSQRIEDTYIECLNELAERPGGEPQGTDTGPAPPRPPAPADPPSSSS